MLIVSATVSFRPKGREQQINAPIMLRFMVSPCREPSAVIAETGHLTFATLHTNSAVKTIDRVINAFPAGQQNQIRSMLSESLKAVGKVFFTGSQIVQASSEQ